MTDLYLGPGGVLRNRLGIASAGRLAAAEDEFALLGIASLSTDPLPPPETYGLAHLKAIHARILGEVYDWAGLTRAEGFVEEATGRVVPPFPCGRGFRKGGDAFADAAEVGALVDRVGRAVERRGRLRGLTRDAFAVDAADVLTRLNAIHPFREGNGRAQRAFVASLAREAGHDVDFTVVPAGRMLAASVAGTRGDPQPMRRLLRDATDPERVRELAFARDALLRLGQPWVDLDVSFLEPWERREGVMVGQAGTQFMMRTRSEVLVGALRDLPTPRPRPGEAVAVTPGGRPTSRRPPLAR